jgi:DNA-binding transcriptional regulator YiaG
LDERKHYAKSRRYSKLSGFFQQHLEHEFDEEQFGIYLRTLRESLSLSIIDLANEISLSKQGFSQWELGRAAPPEKKSNKACEFF